MKFLFRLLLLLSINAAFIISVSSASSDDEEKYKQEYSSDDEDSVHEAVGHANVFDSMGTDEKSSTFQSAQSAANQIAGANGARPLSCLDWNGNEVDWWFAYKEPGGLRYLYYSSLDVDTRTTFHPLNRHLLINDPQTSPLLQTIYHPNNRQPSSEVWLGWNDQPDADAEDEDTGKKKSSTKSSPTDAYGGRVCGVKHAHSKGFYAQNAVVHPENASKRIIGAYAIMTSLPRFPKIFAPSPTPFGTAVRSQLPADPRAIFDSNLSAKAQHFLCLSMPREVVELENKHRVMEVPVNFGAPHVNFLHQYLKTIHPAIMGTNFSDHRADLALWRRYFSLLKSPLNEATRAYLASNDINVKLQAYSWDNLPSLSGDKVPQDRQHVFPLSSAPFYIAANGWAYHTSDFHSRWDCRYSAQNGCVDGSERRCLASFKFETTKMQSALKVNLFAKHGAAVLDLWDDWATLQTVQAQKSSLELCYTGQVVDRYGLLVQSWTDSKTALPRKTDKKIFDEDDQLAATVHIDNVAHFDMPVAHAHPLRVKSSGLDHAKWALSFALDTFNVDDASELTRQEYSFVPTVFVSDLNRTNTMACLKNNTRGRGGGAVAIQSANLWRVLMKLNPRSPKQKFATTGKNRTRRLQKRLRPHAKADFSGSTVDLVSLRPTLFKSLRLSAKEGKKVKRAVSFVPVLNELSQFLRLAEHRPEHAAADAFQSLFRSFAEGKVEGSAASSWRKTLRRIKEIEEDSDVDEERRGSPLLDDPKFISLPAINLYREIPDDSNQADYFLRRVELEPLTPTIVADKQGVLSTVDPIDSLILKIRSLPRSNSTQTQSDLVSTETQTHFVESLSTETQTTEAESFSTVAAAAVDDDLTQLISGLAATGLSDEESESESENEDEEESENDEEESDNEHSDSDQDSDLDSESGSESDHDTEFYAHWRRQHDDEYENDSGYESP